MIKDLFTLNEDENGLSTETSSIFGQLLEEVDVVGAHKNKQDKPDSEKASKSDPNGSATDLGHNSEERLSTMVC